VAGGAFYAAVPLLFFLPLEGLPIFQERLRGIAVLTWLSSLSLALGVRGGSPLRDDASIWPFQKGIRLEGLALEDWILDLGLFSVAALWWASVGTLALGGSGFPTLLLWLALLLLGLATATLTHSVTLCLSALGLRRPSDLTILLAVLSLLAPSLSLRAPPWVLSVATCILPPFRAAVEGHGSLRMGDMGEAAGATLHIVAFSALALSLGILRISAWKPRA